MKKLKYISFLSILLLCFSLVSCEKNDVFDEGQTRHSANGGERIPVDAESAIVEIDDIDP